MLAGDYHSLSERTKLAATRGLIVEPKGSEWPSPPAAPRGSDYGVNLDYQNELCTELAQHSPLLLFSDGACFPHPVSSCTRASWGLVVSDMRGRVLYSEGGPVLAPLPQTPQAWEFCGFLAASRPASGLLVTDCMAVIRVGDCGKVTDASSLGLDRRIRAALSSSAMYSGMAIRAAALRNLVGIDKVDSHKSLSDPSTSEFERLKRKLNDEADRLAKNSCTHPRPSEAFSKQLDAEVKVVEAFCQLAAKLLPLWPRIDLADVPLRPKPAVEQQQEGDARAPPPGAHEWAWEGKYFRCTRCLVWARYLKDNPIRHQTCSLDIPPKFRDSAIRELGHSPVAAGCTDNSWIIFCTQCGAYSTGCQIRSLGTKCSPTMLKDGKEPRIFGALRKGLHPKRQGVRVDLGPWCCL